MTRQVFDTELWKSTMAVLPSMIEEKVHTFGDSDPLARLIAIARGDTGDVTPENCERSPTVKAIITAITRRFAVTPVHIYKKGVVNGRETKTRLPDHPVAKLLAYPNSFQSRVDYWMDASSRLARYGRFYAWKSRGSTGPIRELIPMDPRQITVKQDPTTWDLSFDWNAGQNSETYTSKQMHHVRGPARNGYCGDSPVDDVKQTIALEIAAESFGSSFFANGAIPLMIFQLMAGSAGFKTKEDEKGFIDSFQEALSGNKRHRALLLPKGIETGDPIKIENDKAQFLETRKYQRTVIAGAWGVPPHLVGDLERATFNNVEQQSGDFTLNVIQPYATMFEAAMERDLLTDADVNAGVVIRFNLDSILRADFKSRQEGLRIQREDGIISPNEWREIEGRNPISKDDGGEEYIRPANMTLAGQPPAVPAPPPKAGPTSQGNSE